MAQNNAAMLNPARPMQRQPKGALDGLSDSELESAIEARSSKNAKSSIPSSFLLDREFKKSLSHQLKKAAAQKSSANSGTQGPLSTDNNEWETPRKTFHGLQIKNDTGISTSNSFSNLT